MLVKRWLGDPECREPASSDRLPVHRSESPTGYSSAGCSPAEPASASPVLTIVAQSRSGEAIKCSAQSHCAVHALASRLVMAPCRARRPRRQLECHLYFARRVTFLSCADTQCRSPIETSPASPIEMSRSTVGMRLVGVAWDDGDHDEPQRADASAGADRCR
jgi:hypothetical protein